MFQLFTQISCIIAAWKNMPYCSGIRRVVRGDVSPRDYIKNLTRPCCCAETESERKIYDIFISLVEDTPEFQEEMALRITRILS